MEKSWIHTLVFDLLLYLMLSTTALAKTPYYPLDPVKIRVEVTAEEASGSPPISTRIRIGPVEKNPDSFYVDFFNIESGHCLGSLNFFQKGNVSWEGKGVSPKRFQAENLLMIPGFSVPADVLPVNQLKDAVEPVLYEFCREVGGRNFMDQIQISAYPIDRERAMSEQWLRYGKEIPGKLQMFEAVDVKTGQLIVRQLWSSGDDDGNWWLYEQTPFHRSWRIE